MKYFIMPSIIVRPDSNESIPPKAVTEAIARSTVI